MKTKYKYMKTKTMKTKYNKYKKSRNFAFSLIFRRFFSLGFVTNTVSAINNTFRSLLNSFLCELFLNISMLFIDIARFRGSIKFAIIIPKFSNKCKKVKLLLQS